jgi:hypothetical protein
MAYYGGDIDQSTANSLGSIFGGGDRFGLDGSGWVVATGGGNASATPSAGVPWGMIAIAAVAVVGLLAWKSKR